MKHIITPEEIGQLSRPCNADPLMSERLIGEAEREDIKPRLGDALYILVAEDEPEERFDTLINGGRWEDRKGNQRYLTGLKTALAYFAYARIIRDGNIQATRFGAVIKQDEHSDESEKTERMRHYREAFATGDRYMKEALEYIVCNRADFPEYRLEGSMKSNRTRMTVVGAQKPQDRTCSQKGYTVITTPAPNIEAGPDGTLYIDGTVLSNAIPQAIKNIDAQQADIDEAEEKRVQAENQRELNEDLRQQATTKAVQNANDAAKRATDAATGVEEAITAANQAAETANKAAADVKKLGDSISAEEEKRATAETERVLSENKRNTNEQKREQSEQGRATAEQGRETSEVNRVASETARVKAEAQRQTDTAAAVKSAEDAAAAANTAAGKADAAAANAQQVADTYKTELDGKQSKTDESLKTTDKTVAGAINEIYDNMIIATEFTQSDIDELWQE